jgi:hypothetical protein
MSHVVDDIVNPIGAITGIDPVKQATGFTGTGFQAKPQAQGSSSQQAASSSGGGGGNKSSSAGDMLNQLVGQNLQQQKAMNNQAPAQIQSFTPVASTGFNPVQYSQPQFPQGGMGFGQQLAQLGTPQAMQSAMNVAGRWFSQ